MGDRHETSHLPLPESDVEYLASKEYRCELVPNAQSPSEKLLIIYGYDLGEMYMPRTVDLITKIPPGYPDAELDMFWVYPAVTRRDGSMPAQVCLDLNHAGRVWQRFSRHREASQRWRMGVDNIASHLMFIRSALDSGR